MVLLCTQHFVHFSFKSKFKQLNCNHEKIVYNFVLSAYLLYLFYIYHDRDGNSKLCKRCSILENYKKSSLQFVHHVRTYNIIVDIFPNILQFSHPKLWFRFWKIIKININRKSSSLWKNRYNYKFLHGVLFMRC